MFEVTRLYSLHIESDLLAPMVTFDVALIFLTASIHAMSHGCVFVVSLISLFICLETCGASNAGS